jgi:hypothetical protein
MLTRRCTRHPHRVIRSRVQGIGLLDCVNERDVPPIPPLFLPRPNLVVNGDTVLHKLKDRPDGMFLDRCVYPCKHARSTSPLPLGYSRRARKAWTASAAPLPTTLKP